MNPHMHTQMQIRNNAEQMNSYFADLNEWQDQITKKDKRLRDGEVDVLQTLLVLAGSHRGVAGG